MQATPTPLLDDIVEERRGADAAEARLLAKVADYADQHPVIGDVVPASWTDPTILGPSASLAGAGTPEVAEDAVIALGAALGVSYHSALALVGDVLELRHRLPRLWTLVHDGTLQAWKARQAARETRWLSPQAVEFVDRHLAVAASKGKWTSVTATDAVRLAVARFETDQARERERNAKRSRGVWFDQRHLDGQVATTHLTAALDTMDAKVLDETLTDLAVQLHALGDQTSVDERRATALGILADPQAALDLVSTGSTDREGGSTARASRAVLYVHLDPHTATVETAGALTRHLLNTWLDRTDKITIRPVIDLADTTVAVDRHDPPDAMRDQVVLRDPTCVFPGCPIRSRACDLDHVVPFDDTGPPGQTSPANLAPLCRRHHRAKTHQGWTYHWTSPDGRHYDVP